MSKSKGTPPLRRWQGEATDAITAEWREPDNQPLATSCPGSGKTVLGAHLGRIAVDDFDSGFVLCVGPGTNVKESWATEFENFGLKASAKIKNETLRGRLQYGEKLTGDLKAMCVTYAQLAKDASFFAELMRRTNGTLIADEPHHAAETEAFGEALNLVSEAAKLRLALTGTPFNTSGTSLSMIRSTEGFRKDGTKVRIAIPTYTYSYGDAISEDVCRPVEFVTVMGRGEVTYQSLLEQTTWKKVVDLAQAKRTDRLNALLDPRGEFIPEMLETGIKALLDFQQTDKRAGMLIAVSDKDEGTAVAQLLDVLLKENPAWSHLSVAEIYHDTPGAHIRLEQLKSDGTDIVVAVKMISEGVNIPRLRVGVYATNCLTRLFFIQLVGRFLRWEKRLDAYQFAKVIIPAHVDLLEFAREIERQVNEATIPEEGVGGGLGGGPIDTEILQATSEATGKGAILRGDSEEDITLAADFFQRYPDYVGGRIPDLWATRIERDIREGGGPQQQHSNDSPQQPRYADAFKPRAVRTPRKNNEMLVSRVVRMLPRNGETDAAMFNRVNGAANKAIGIRKVDDLTTDEEFGERGTFLRQWLTALNAGRPFQT